MKYILDVFGLCIVAHYKDQQWSLFLKSQSQGILRKWGLPIPEDIKNIDQLIIYLDDIYHEKATESKNKIEVLEVRQE